MPLILQPKHWKQFQHYKHRTPPWIKLNRSLLDDYDFHGLPDASKALAPLLWLIASDHIDGHFDASCEVLSFRLRQPIDKIESSINVLINKGFLLVIQDDSNTLAERSQNADTEERQSRVETETDISPSALVADATELFKKFWDIYPKKESKLTAQKAWNKLKENDRQLAVKALPYHMKIWNDPQFIPHASTWLNKRRFEDVLTNQTAVPKEANWWSNESSMIKKGREVGIEARAGESTNEFIGRIRARL